jgi:hypothetical protein
MMSFIGTPLQKITASSTVVAGDNGVMDVYTHPALHGRRQIIPTPPSTARELRLPKTVELEQRIARLEMKLQHACEELEVTRQRMAALQARVDHYLARFGQY